MDFLRPVCQRLRAGVLFAVLLEWASAAEAQSLAPRLDEGALRQRLRFDADWRVHHGGAEGAFRTYPKRKTIGSENGDSCDAWVAAKGKDYVAGQFLWTGFGYLGKAGRFPNRSKDARLMHLSAFEKPGFYLRKSLWTDEAAIHLAEVAPDKAHVVDQEGRTVLRAAHEVAFDVIGPSEIVAVGNGNRNSAAAYGSAVRKTYEGKFPVRVQSIREPGPARVTASSGDL